MSYFVAESLADVDAYLEGHQHPRGIIAQDTETTGLDAKVHHMVGTSISLAPETALYVPFRHKIGTNLPVAPVLDRIQSVVDARALTTVFFNAKFDRTFLKQDHMEAVLFRDVMQMAYLANCERKSRGLKVLAKEDVGFDMARFDSLFDPVERKAGDFVIARKLPTRCRDYACADADATFRLDIHYDWVLEAFQFAMNVDTRLVDIVAEMELEGGLELNTPFIEEQEKKLKWRSEALEAIIYRCAGEVFNLGHPKTLGAILFEKLGFPHPFAGTKFERTNTGNWVTNEETLEKLSETEPLADMIINYRKVTNVYNRYMKRLRFLIDNDKKPRFTLNIVTATTFRFTAPGGEPDPSKKRYDGKSGLNGQAISKGVQKDVFGVDLSAAGSAREYIDGLSEDDLLVDLSSEFEDTELQTVLSDDAWNAMVTELPYVTGTARANATGDNFTGLMCFRDTCDGCPAACTASGIDTTRRWVEAVQLVPSVRKAFRSPDGFQLVSLDYDRQEIVIAANLSKEPVWLKALSASDEFEKDIHLQTALAAFDHDRASWEALDPSVAKGLRATGKSLNFGTLFGATPQKLARTMGIPISKAEQIWEDYRRGMVTLFRWIAQTQVNARASGYTSTYFGRRRPLAHYYAAGGKMASFADRAAVNTPIQGTGADCIRIAMVKIDSMLKREQIDRSQGFFGLQIHDELMYVVRDDLVNTIAPMIQDAMQFPVKSWDVQLEAGVKVGPVWGEQEPLLLAA